ncbi:MAG: amidohydrolase, partial [Planctomycetaceae bacterium]|nr:amidohydrolase [Planctomycetaceae bacterium]
MSHVFPAVRISHAIAGICALSLIGVAGSTRSEELAAWAKANLEEIVGLYRHFHAHPELSFLETETAARLAKELRAVGAEVTEKIGGTGVVGILKNGQGRTVLVRTDLDALPVTEQTGLAYASQVKVKGEAGETGVMHACGHDIH